MSHPQGGEWKREYGFAGYHSAVERVRTILSLEKAAHNSEQLSNSWNRGGALIVGPSGVGKTLLCRSVLEAEKERRDGYGVLFIDCTVCLCLLGMHDHQPDTEVPNSPDCAIRGNRSI